MRKLITFSTLLIAIFVIFSSFENNQQKFDNPPSEFELLTQYLEENGNFINSALAPALIEASELKDLLKNNGNNSDNKAMATINQRIVTSMPFIKV